MDQRVPEADQQPQPAFGQDRTLEFDALTWGSEHALKALIEYQAETLHFIARRTYSDLEFMRRLRDCTGWQEIAQLQQSWLTDCDYGKEWGRMVGTSFQRANSDTPLQWLMYRPVPRKRGNGLAD